MKKIIYLCFFTIFSIIASTFIWELIQIPYNGNKNILGSYSLNQYNPSNEILRFISFISIPLITFFITYKILYKDRQINIYHLLKFENDNVGQQLPEDLQAPNFYLKPLFKDQKNINIVKDAMFSSTNEPGGTSYRHRMENPKFTFAGKTGSSQIKRFTEAQREAEVKQKDLNYKDRDHALFIAFAPYKNPKYAVSVVVEHGGSGGSAAAPIAKQVIKKVIERDHLRKKINYSEEGTV